MTDMLIMIATLAAAGLFAGFVAGLFGIGGGTVLVPALVFVFAHLGYDGPRLLHLAVGTSLGVIALTALRSAQAHRAHGAVDEGVLRDWRVWVALGAGIGAVGAMFVSRAALGCVYGGLALLVAAYMGLWPEGRVVRTTPPTGPARRVIAGGIGAASALMGVGGGAFGSATLSLCGMPIHRAIATASGLGVFIAVPAMIGYALHPAGAGQPPLSLGDVNLPGLVVLGLFSVITAPMGARLAHLLDRTALRRAFAIYMLITAGYVVVKSAM
jgi:uncharacterized membrane protein YfcA